MAFIRGANTVTDGLVLSLDAANTKSYPGSGTTWKDMSGNGNNGTLTNGPTFNSANGGSIVFDGINDYCILPLTNIVIGNNQQNITVSQWVKYTSSIRLYSLALKRADADGSLISIVMNSINGGGVISVGSIELLYRSPSNVFVFNNHTDGYNNGQWYMITGTFSSTEGKLYINGELKTTTNTGLLSSANSPYNSFVGAFAVDQLWFNGNIANTSIYTRTLSASEVLQNYNAQKSRFEL